MLTSDVPTHMIWSPKASVTVRAVMTIYASMSHHVPIQDLLLGEASLTDHTLILLNFIVHALNVPFQITSLSELIPALQAQVPPLPTMHCTFVVLQVSAPTEPVPTDIT